MKGLQQHRQAAFDLDDLVKVAAAMLRRLRVQTSDARVSPAPDARTVRYYQTLGLLDKPSRYEGRRAMYDYRHLLQLLCVKRLQEEGHPLHLIQSGLAGKTTRDLEAALARLEDEPAPMTPPPSPRSAIMASEIIPGVTVIIDPQRVEDPESIMDLIAKSLAHYRENRS